MACEFDYVYILNFNYEKTLHITITGKYVVLEPSGNGRSRRYHREVN